MKRPGWIQWRSKPAAFHLVSLQWAGTTQGHLRLWGWSGEWPGLGEQVHKASGRSREVGPRTLCAPFLEPLACSLAGASSSLHSEVSHQGLGQAIVLRNWAPPSPSISLGLWHLISHYPPLPSLLTFY